MSKFWFNKLPEAISRARSAVDPEGITRYLLCALERRGRVTGLLFCDQSGRSRDGSPIQTGVIEDRAWVKGTSSSSQLTVSMWLRIVRTKRGYGSRRPLALTLN